MPFVTATRGTAATTAVALLPPLRHCCCHCGTAAATVSLLLPLWHGCCHCGTTAATAVELLLPCGTAAATVALLLPLQTLLLTLWHCCCQCGTTADTVALNAATVTLLLPLHWWDCDITADTVALLLLLRYCYHSLTSEARIIRVIRLPNNILLIGFYIVYS